MGMRCKVGGGALVLAVMVGCEPLEGDGRPVEGDGTSLYRGEPSWCDDMASVDDLGDRYRQGQLRTTLSELLARRYEPGEAFIDAQSDDELTGWFSRPDSFPVVFRESRTAVHEGSHLWGFERLTADTYAYRIVDDSLILETLRVDSVGRGIVRDVHPDLGNDLYAEVYLEWTGDQDFHTLLDELNAYVHDLAAAHCTRDSLGLAQTSARRAVFTFQFYVEAYLGQARRHHPDSYDALVSDLDTRSAILTVWDRADEWLDRTEGVDAVSLSEQPARSWVSSREIDRLR